VNSDTRMQATSFTLCCQLYSTTVLNDRGNSNESFLLRKHGDCAKSKIPAQKEVRKLTRGCSIVARQPRSRKSLPA